MKNILITGIRGFIGFNAIQQWVENNNEYNYIGLDAETYADKFMLAQKNDWLIEHQIPVYRIDLSLDKCELDLTTLVERHQIDTIVNFAAESHVDNSIKNPTIFYKSNTIGFVHILNIAKKFNIRVHQISTDEVIGSKTPEDYCKEDAILCPSSPYSSSKASAELIAQAYMKTFGMNITISRCTNNFGEWQMTEKLIPTVLKNALNENKIPVYGNGMQRRFWIDVEDHNDAVMFILKHGINGETYNISPDSRNLVYNIDLIKDILKIVGKPESLIEFVEDRPAHDTCYYLDSSKLENLGFKSTRKFEKTLERTIKWYRENLQFV